MRVTTSPGLPVLRNVLLGGADEGCRVTRRAPPRGGTAPETVELGRCLGHCSCSATIRVTRASAWSAAGGAARRGVPRFGG